MKKLYVGPVIGPMQFGVLWSNHNEHNKRSKAPALEKAATRLLFDSLAPIKASIVTKNNDMSQFEIELENPTSPAYRPLFFDRGTEYGEGHTYWEALCHCLPTREVITSCSARYFNSKMGFGFAAQHLPAPYAVRRRFALFEFLSLKIVAFIEAIRELNAPLLEALAAKLTSLDIQVISFVTSQRKLAHYDSLMRSSKVHSAMQRFKFISMVHRAISSDCCTTTTSSLRCTWASH
jgi:hypothetical protein